MVALDGNYEQTCPLKTCAAKNDFDAEKCWNCGTAFEKTHPSLSTKPITLDMFTEEDCINLKAYFPDDA